MDPKSYERYSRQILFGEIGEAGQQRLLDSSAVIVGCGALGTALANLLVRAGVGRLRIVDRDFVEPSNLQRQTLFEESDAAEALPKAVAAERRLRAINSGVSVEGIVADVGPKNAEELLRGFPLILDGTDNFETRFLLNDVAIHLNVPWIYAAVVASYGVTLTVRPGVTACLACALESGVPIRRWEFFRGSRFWRSGKRIGCFLCRQRRRCWSGRYLRYRRSSWGRRRRDCLDRSRGCDQAARRQIRIRGSAPDFF